MARTRVLLATAALAATGALWLAGCGGPDGTRVAPLVSVSPCAIDTLSPQAAAPTDLRWRDIADVLYSGAFPSEFEYGPPSASVVTADYADSAPTLSGTIHARNLKPWFAYQMKLEGKKGLLGTTAAQNASDPQAWASFQIGSVGRWWCSTCGNITDSGLTTCVKKRGHDVRGYLLFDWFVTDALGNADHEFALDSSFHVLWKTSQRLPRSQDSAAIPYAISRGAYAYPDAAVGTTDTVSVYAEWEPNRPLPGTVQLAEGAYDVQFILTEESFHSTADGGGYWAKVLAGDVAFAVGETPLPPPTGYGTISGRVTAGKTGVGGAVVTVLGTGQTATTNGAGKYSIASVPVGSYSMTAAAAGYSTATASGVVVTAGATTTVNFALTP